MRVFITGANGFVGSNLIQLFRKEGHDVTALVRSTSAAKAFPEEVSVVVGRSTESGRWQEAVPGHDVLINLAGASIFRRWNEEYKKLLRDSRLRTTRNLVDAVRDGDAVTLLSTSAVGYYGFTGDEELDETSLPGSDFLAILARDWEEEAFKAQEKGVRVVTTRFGVVLGDDGGALDQMVRPFRFFVGGPLGAGRQWFSWIHVRDLCRAALFVASSRDVRGPVNFTAPVPVRNRDLAAEIGTALNRPSFMPAPGFMIRLVMGEFGDVILKGQRVVPGVLQAKGFLFDFPTIKDALDDLLNG
ncbi:MAG: TIGR01777 family oxidoreductase [Desulfomonilaceae bacterium]|nr:TIGR01777 family oxidoreductase [Desulfomonilaceae bacterium]